MVQIEEVPEEGSKMQTVCMPLKHGDATVTRIVATEGFPPKFVSLGHSKGIQGFQGIDGGSEQLGFRPAFQHAPAKTKIRIAHIAVKGRFLVAATNDAYGELMIWEMGNWNLMQTIKVACEEDDPEGVLRPASVACLAYDGAHIAVGTHQGQAKTWKQPAENTDFVQLLVPLQVDKEQPVSNLMLSGGLLCAFSVTKQTFVTWALADGKLQHAWQAEKVSGSKPLVHVSMVENLVVSVHQHPHQEDVPPELPSIQILDVLSGEGGRVPDKEGCVTAEDGAVLCLAFNAQVVCVGLESGGLVVFHVQEEYQAWRRNHAGSVGALACVPGESSRIISGGADRWIRLWTSKGAPIAALELGAQVTCLTVKHPRVVVCGTSKGFVEVVALPSEDATIESKDVGAKASKASSGSLIKYDQYFEDNQGKVHRIQDLPDAFSKLVIPVDNNIPEVSSSGEKTSAKDGDEAVKTMAKGLQGAFAKKEGLVTKEEEEKAKEAAKKKESAPKDTSRPDLGDNKGVARNPDLPMDESRKCASDNCIAREVGTKKFLRCGRCKMVVYCSQHCQRTHWRDGHSSECVSK